ncbi:unnamed protein product [Auanema sp. JU1783]|nr:unnamed protein product [Auanema sp. JU1783]
MTDLVRQGFICPFCMCDLGDFPSLQTHVETVHPEEEAEGDLTDVVLQNMKGLFDKAKRGIRKIDAKVSLDLAQVNVGVSNSMTNLSNYANAVQDKARPRPAPVIRPPPVRAEIGIVRSHKELFIQNRDASVNESAVRTNMLIIRLDRLINERPNDPSKRKDFEREIVPWLDDRDSTVCPSCAAKFGLTRRRHHCRLCGKVMCHQCSRFLSFLSARKLTNPSLLSYTEPEETITQEPGSPSHGRKLLEITQKTTEKMKMFFEGAVSKISNDGSEGSLGSLLQQDATECLRVCTSCLTDLRRREEMMEQHVAPALAEQYGTLDISLREIASLSPGYIRMASSINNGETMYTLRDAEEMRQKIYQKQAQIDSLSKRILEGGDEKALKELQLRKNIRYVAITTLEEVISGMTSLPTPEQYQKLVEKHKQIIARQIEEARACQIDKPPKLVTQKPPLSSSYSSPITTVSSRTKATDEGWTPNQTRAYNPFLDEEDMQHPMYEQRDIIKGYLTQAVAAGRLEEVDMLERNLKDLEEEMRKMGLQTH